MWTRVSIPIWVILFIALVVVLLAGPLWQLPGLPGGTADSQVHLHRSAAVYRAFEDGVFWPRWFPSVYNGLGSPTFHHYSPGLFWLVAAVHWAGTRLDLALKLVTTAVFILSGFGVYAWLRYVFSPEASLAGAALYLFHPRIWSRAFYSPGPFGGAYPQLLGLLLLPVCLWAITALHRQGRLRHWIVACVSLTALVYCHNLTAMIGACVLFLYWLMLAAGYRKTDGLLRCAVAGLLAALLSAAFWLPALADFSYIQGDKVREGYFHFSNHFLEWQQLFSFQSPVLDSRDGNPLVSIVTFGAASWLALGAGLVSIPFATRGGRWVWGVAGVLFALAMLALTLSFSEPLWETIPGLSFLQFPYRFLGIAPLGAIPAAALAVDVWPARWRWLPGVALVAALSIVLIPYLFPAHTQIIHPVQSVKTLSAEDTRLVEQTSRLWGMTTSNEFLVQGANLEVITGEMPEPSATRPEWNTHHEASFDLSAQTEPMLLRLHYHPGWSAGGQAVLTRGQDGWMQVSELRNPDEALAVRWEGTVAQRWGERMSLVGLLASAAGILFLALRNRGKFWGGGSGKKGMGNEAPCFGQRSSTLALGAMAGCVLIFAVVRFALDRSSGGPFLLHSPSGQLAFSVEGQQETLGAASSSQVTLLGWELLSSETPKPGGRVRVRLYWQPNGPIKEELLSFLHLYTPALQRSWAVDNRGVPRPDSQWWDPDRYYVDDLFLELPPDLPPITYSLVAGLVTSEGERLNVASSTDNLLYLRSLDVAPTRPGLLQIVRPTTQAPAATADGLRLQGYDLLPKSGESTLRLFWETGDGVSNDWITYIHLHNSRGERVAQFDGPALAGLLPTSQWHRNALYIDRRQLKIPAELEAGRYLFRAGLYNRASGERLPFQPDAKGELHFEEGQLLIPLTVAPSSGARD